MSLWGGGSADSLNAKFLVRGSAVAEPDNCIATEQGWVIVITKMMPRPNSTMKS